MPSILDDFPFPFSDPRAQELQLTLTQLYPSVPQAITVAQRAGIDITFINAQQAPALFWHDVLHQSAGAGLTRPLVEEVRTLLNDRAPSRPFLDALLADQPVATAAEPRRADGSAVFLAGDDTIHEPEALLYRDDLTLQIGRVAALITALQRLLVLAPTVCRLVVDFSGTVMYGTAFRVADDMLLTNWHVLNHLDTGARATAVSAEFGYEDDGHGGVLAPVVIPCDVKTVVADKTDDWGVIRASQPLRPEWPIVKLSEAVDPVVGGLAFIVQHPSGERKRLGYVRNQVSAFNDRVVHYLTDTERGSSGSPIFDIQGKLIGLHHAGGAPQTVVGRSPMAKNEGIRISRVVAGLQAQGIDVP